MTRLAKSWLTEGLTFETVWAEVQAIQQKLNHTMLTKDQVRAWHNALQLALDDLKAAGLGTYRLQATLRAELPLETPYKTLFVEASGWDTTVWVGTAHDDTHPGPLVVRTYNLAHPPIGGTVRHGKHLYWTKPPEET